MLRRLVKLITGHKHKINRSFTFVNPRSDDSALYGWCKCGKTYGTGIGWFDSPMTRDEIIEMALRAYETPGDNRTQ